MGFFVLFVQALIMGVSSFFVGLCPMMFSSLASGKRLKMASYVGMGLLLGAALTVVIPEGVSTIYQSTVKPATTSPSASRMLVSRSSVVSPLSPDAALWLFDTSSVAATALSSSNSETRDSHKHHDDDDDDDDDDEHDHDDDDKHYGSDPTRAIGLSLLSGFVFMMIIEQSTHSHKAPGQPGIHNHRSPSPHHLDRLTSSAPLLRSPEPALSSSDLPPPTWHSLVRRASEGALGDEHTHAHDHDHEEDGEAIPPHSPPPVSSPTQTASDLKGGSSSCAGGGAGKGADYQKSFSKTLGLVIHSAADGIALGASARSEKEGLGLVVFLAIFIHKIPASIGLCTTLMNDGLPRGFIRERIAIFSAAASAGAILTYGLINLLAGGLAQSSLQWWTGIALLFSGGTFLYVATVLQDLEGDHSTHHDEPGLELPRAARLVLLVLGMFTPFVLSSFVSHQH